MQIKIRITIRLTPILTKMQNLYCQKGFEVNLSSLENYSLKREDSGNAI